MDTLFRLVSLQSSDQQQHQHQQQHHHHSNSSFNSSRTSSSSRSSKNQQHNQSPLHHHNNNNYYYQQQQQQQQSPYYYNYSSSQQHNYQYQYQQQLQQYSACYSQDQEEEQEEECCNQQQQHLYMDEDHFSSSSSSKHHLPPINPSSSSSSSNINRPPTLFSLPAAAHLTTTTTNTLDLINAAPGARWASDLLLDCARAVAARDNPRVQQLMWMLNELSSPYGDTEQKLASYFLQALFARLASSGPRTLRTLLSASDRTASFDSTRRLALRFQELSPWSSFGHVASNGAILESFLATAADNVPQNLHILDVSNTFCTQWPTLLEALATRSADDTPHLTITTVVVSSPASPSPSSSSVHRVMKEIGARMEKFARLMGVPFKFNIVHHAGDLSTLDLDPYLHLADNSALAVNMINSLHGVSPVGRRRDAFLSSLRRLRPRIVTVVEEEAELDSTTDNEEEGSSFLKGFRESLRFFSAYFDSLEESFPKTSNERLALERAAGRAVVDLVACPAEESTERRGTAAGWSRRMRGAGFSPAGFSDDVADDVRALLRRYKEGWAMVPAAGGGGDDVVGPSEGIFLTWKEQAVVWASAWRM